MIKLRLWLGLLAWWLFLFYNIERITEQVNIASFLYVYILFVAGAVVALQRLFKRRWAFVPYNVLVLIGFLVIKWLLGYDLFHEGLLLTITEAVAIVVTLVIVWQVGKVIWEFEDTIANLTFQQVGIPPRVYETTDTEDLYREIKRSRRFRHDLTLLLVRPNYDLPKATISALLADLQKRMLKRFIQVRMARMMSDVLRDSDLIVLSEGDFIVLLPETTETESAVLVSRLKKLASSELKVDVNIGSAEFPSKALTLRGLLDTAEVMLTTQAAEKEPAPPQGMTPVSSSATGRE
jgi:hypothetical protein